MSDWREQATVPASDTTHAAREGSSRARLLSPSASLDLLCFDVGTERFATLLDAIDEVIDGAELSLSTAGTRVAGVLRVRGALLPAHAPDAVLSCALTSSLPLALVFPVHNHRVALLVDHAEAAVGVSMATFRDLPSLTGADRVLVGAVRVGDRWVGLVDPEALVEAMHATPANEDV